MEVAITKMSPNGQIVIPADIRKDAKIDPSSKFLVFNKGGDIILKRLSKDILEEELKLFESILEGEKDIREGRYIRVDSKMSTKEMDRLLRGK